jgi:DNA-directed RNA polymerase alpha subunit
MTAEITLDTPLKDLEMSVRLRNALLNEYIRLYGPLGGRTPTIRNFVHLSDSELMRIPNLGRWSLREWNVVVDRATGSRNLIVEEKEAEEHALKKIRAHLNNIAGAHTMLATHYKKLAGIISPLS